MTWSEGDVWLLAADLPAGEHEFKVRKGQGPTGGRSVCEYEVVMFLLILQDGRCARAGVGC